MFKKCMAFIVTLAIIATMLVVPAINASAEVMDITDYVPAEGDTMLDGKITKITSYNGTSYDYGVEIKEIDENISEFYTKDTRATIPSAITRPQGGLQYDLNTETIKKGDKYVFIIKVRKVNESDVVPNLVFGVADASMGGKAAGWGWKAQTIYAKDITSTEWQTIVQEIEIPYDGTASTVAVLGLGAGCTNDSYKGKTAFEFRPGAAVEIDFSSVFLGKLSAYDIGFELSASEAAIGEVVTGEAKIVDRVGDPTNYKQDFTYYVTDTDGNTVEGFEITEPKEGEVTVKAGSTAAPGSYVVLAVSDVYPGFKKTAPISVVYGDVKSSEGNEIKVSVSGKSIVGVTDVVTFSASVENEGTPVEHTAPFVWTAINSDKMTVCEYITLTPSEDTTTAQLSLDLSIPEDTYYIMTTSLGMTTLTQITADKSGDVENIVSNIKDEKTDEISENMEVYLAVLELSDTVCASASADSLSKVLAETANDEDISDYDIPALQEFFTRAAIVSLYNSNEKGVTLYDENGDFAFAEELKLSAIDADEVTLWKLFAGDKDTDALLSAKGKNELQAALKADDSIGSYNDFVEAVKENIILYTLAYPDVLGFGYVEDVLTEKNLKAVGIEDSAYLDLSDKSEANESIAGTLLDMEELAEILDDVTEPEEEEEDDDEVTVSKGSGFVGSFSSGSKEKEEEEKPSDSNSINLDAVFTDLPKEHWASSDVYFLREIGVINGTTETTFEPEAMVTREQFIKMLVQAFKVPSATSGSTFADVDNSAWYAPYVKAAYESGIVNGMGDGSFGIGKTITRQDACVMLARVLKFDTNNELVPSFDDAEGISSYAKGAVTALTEYSIVNGFDDNTFRATAVCTRSQAAKIVASAITINNSILTGGSN